MNLRLISALLGGIPAFLAVLWWKHDSSSTVHAPLAQLQRINEVQIVPLTASQAIVAWENAFLADSSAQGQLDAFAHLALLQAKDFPPLIRSIQDKGQINLWLGQAVLARWFEIDALSAMDWIRKRPASSRGGSIQDTLIPMLGGTWAARDPQGFFRWWAEEFSTLGGMNFWDSLNWKPVDDLARVDMHLAAQLELKRTQFANRSNFRTLIKNSADAETVAGVLIENRVNLTDEQIQNFLEMLRQRWFAVDSGAWDIWANSHADVVNLLRKQYPALEAITRFQNSVDPISDANQWLQRVAPEARSKTLNSIVNLWAAADLNGAGAWLDTQSHGSTAWPAIETFAVLAAQEDPSGAFACATTIEDPTRRARTERRVYLKWHGSDAPAAEAWLKTSGWSDARKEAVQEMAATQ